MGDSSDTVLVEEIDYGDEDSVKQATDLLLQKELASEQVIQEHNVEQEVVETEAITLATADGQIVRVISKEQYERLLAVASKSKTYKCDTCNRRFTNTNAF